MNMSTCIMTVRIVVQNSLDNLRCRVQTIVRLSCYLMEGVRNFRMRVIVVLKLVQHALLTSV